MESFSWVSEGPSPLKETQTVKKYFWRWSSPGSPPAGLNSFFNCFADHLLYFQHVLLLRDASQTCTTAPRSHHGGRQYPSSKSRLGIKWTLFSNSFFLIQAAMGFGGILACLLALTAYAANISWRYAAFLSAALTIPGVILAWVWCILKECFIICLLFGSIARLQKNSLVFLFYNSLIRSHCLLLIEAHGGPIAWVAAVTPRHQIQIMCPVCGCARVRVSVCESAVHTCMLT